MLKTFLAVIYCLEQETGRRRQAITVSKAEDKCIPTSVTEQHRKQSFMPHPLSQRATLAALCYSVNIGNGFSPFSNYYFFLKSGINHVPKESVQQFSCPSLAAVNVMHIHMFQY